MAVMTASVNISAMSVPGQCEHVSHLSDKVISGHFSNGSTSDHVSDDRTSDHVCDNGRTRDDILTGMTTDISAMTEISVMTHE